MTGMLNTLLDINQIEVGAVKPEIADVPVNELFDRLREELSYHAQAAGLALRAGSVRTVSSERSASARANDPQYDLQRAEIYRGDKVLVGCRRHQGESASTKLDTGIGIPASELKSIFDEYHQVDNLARQRSQGLGLGLSIVKSLGELLGHPIGVRSLQGKGSVFSIEVPLQPSGHSSAADRHPHVYRSAPSQTAPRTGAILIIEDDPEVRERLKLFLHEEGYAISTAVDGPAVFGSGNARHDATGSCPCGLQSAKRPEWRSDL